MGAQKTASMEFVFRAPIYISITYIKDYKIKLQSLRNILQ